MGLLVLPGNRHRMGRDGPSLNAGPARGVLTPAHLAMGVELEPRTAGLGGTARPKTLGQRPGRENTGVKLVKTPTTNG